MRRPGRHEPTSGRAPREGWPAVLIRNGADVRHFTGAPPRWFLEGLPRPVIGYFAEDCFVHHFGQGSFAKLRPDFYEEVFATNRRRFEEKWKTEWIPHQYRPGVTAEEGGYDPAGFASPKRRV